MMIPKLIKTVRHGDARGWFSETYSAARLIDMGIDAVFVQDNHSFSREPNTIRGLHFQTPPFAQSKLVRCLKGRIWDVIVDLRHGSPTYGNWAGVELSEENGDQLFVPMGFAHGFQTLTENCEIAYKVSAPYAPQHDGGLMWNDGDIGVQWQTVDTPLMVSAKDAELPNLSHWQSPFEYDGVPMPATLS